MSIPQPPASAATGPEPAARPTLSRDLAEFLIELSIVLHKFSIYPADHPALEPAVEGLMFRCEQLLADRSSLSVGVARRQLVIEGVATDTKNPVLTDLAGRLNRHQLGAITFAREVRRDELVEFLRLVAVEADRSTRPRSLAVDPRATSWSHIRLYPPLYDRPDLIEESGQEAAGADDPKARSQRTRAAQLWIGLARAALAAGEEGGEAGGSPPPAPGTDAADETPPDDSGHEPTDPETVARAIDGSPSDAAYDQVIVGYMLQIAEKLRNAGSREALQLRKRMSRLVAALEPKTLERLLDMGGDGLQRRRFLLDASQGMAVGAVLDLIRAAGETEKQTISHSLLRMLQKLARHADSEVGERKAIAEESVRDQVGTLLRGWSLEDPNPDGYGKALEALSKSDAVEGSAEATLTAAPRRIVTMALELDVTGEPLMRAVDELARNGQLGWIAETLTAAQPTGATAEIWRLVGTPENLAQVVGDEPIDTGMLDALLPHVGAAAAGPMLDAFSEDEEARSRRLLLDRLVELGPPVGPAALERLADPRWYVQRNMLSILGDLEQPPADFRPTEFSQHEDARVRREALRIVLRDPEARDQGLLLALGDSDERMVRTALTAALESCPAAAMSGVASLAVSGVSEDLRVLAIRVLGASADRTALPVLLDLTRPRKAILSVRPPPKTPAYLAALAALRNFATEPDARAVLDQAARSQDNEVVQAVTGGEPHR